MPTLAVRVPDPLFEEFQAVAAARDQKPSDFLRDLVREAVRSDQTDRDDEVGPSDQARVPPTLSTFQRQQLALQHELAALQYDALAAAGVTSVPVGADDAAEDGDLVVDRQWPVDPVQEASEHRWRARALRLGWVVEYQREFVAIEPELPRSETSFVIDVLEMFFWLHSSVTRLPEDQAGRFTRLLFPGFDHNSARESRLAEYARWVLSQGKWAGVDMYARGEGLNSHLPQAARYERMLRVFGPMWQVKRAEGAARDADDAYRFSLTELEQILAA